jgi:hypothetical protein
MMAKPVGLIKNLRIFIHGTLYTQFKLSGTFWDSTYVLPETHLQLLICIDHQASTAGRWQMAKLFYIPSHSLQQRTDKIPASGKSFKRATNKSILLLLECSTRTQENPGDAIESSWSFRVLQHACIHTYLNSPVSDCVGSMGENKRIIKIEEDCLQISSTRWQGPILQCGCDLYGLLQSLK